jgi:hypothetical protein
MAFADIGLSEEFGVETVIENIKTFLFNRFKHSIFANTFQSLG